MTNLEIEDVLSSIRRLVTEYPRPSGPRGQGRLVLTPDCRVDPGETLPAAANVAANAAAPGDVPVASASAEQVTIGSVHVDTGGSRTDAASAAIADGVDPAPDRLWDHGPSLEERIAELEEAVAATAGEWEPDGSEEGAGRLTGEMPPLFESARARHADGAPASGWTPPDQPAPDVAEAAVDAAAAGPVVAATGWAGETAGTDPAEAIAEEPAEEDGDRFGGSFDTAAEESVIDEEMLRDMVAEFVRQELQGALGERITRNVRKLVRAEVQRALASRDLS